jgi:hypothetical protein
MAWAGAGQRHQVRNTKQVAAGVCVRQQAAGQNQIRMGQANGKHYGPGDGTGNLGERPLDGTGFGPKTGIRNGTGTCDGTGPHGAARQIRKPGGGR